MKKAWVLNYPLSARRRLWSDWVNAQADLSLCWAHTHFVGFVMSWLILLHGKTIYWSNFMIIAAIISGVPILRGCKGFSVYGIWALFPFLFMMTYGPFYFLVYDIWGLHFQHIKLSKPYTLDDLKKNKIQKWVPLRAMKTFIRKKMGHTT